MTTNPPPPTAAEWAILTAATLGIALALTHAPGGPARWASRALAFITPPPARGVWSCTACLAPWVALAACAAWAFGWLTPARLLWALPFVVYTAAFVLAKAAGGCGGCADADPTPPPTTEEHPPWPNR